MTVYTFIKIHVEVDQSSSNPCCSRSSVLCSTVSSLQVQHRPHHPRRILALPQTKPCPACQLSPENCSSSLVSLLNFSQANRHTVPPSTGPTAAPEHSTVLPALPPPSPGGLISTPPNAWPTPEVTLTPQPGHGQDPPPITQGSVHRSLPLALPLN